MNKLYKKGFVITVLLVLSTLMMFGSAFALLNDSYTETIEVTVSNVDIAGQDGDVYLEIASMPGNPVTEISSGYTYNVVGTVENNSTVDTTVTVDTSNINSAYGVNVATPSVDVLEGNDINVADFGITITPTPLATDGNLTILFNAAEDTTI